MSGEAKNSQIQTISNDADFETFIKQSSKYLTVVHFFAPWAPQCQQIDEVLCELSKASSAVKIIKVEAESFPAISLKYGINAVPTCVLVKGTAEVDRVNGVNAADLTKKVQQHAGLTGGVSVAQRVAPAESLNDRLKKLVNTAPVMIFMKGSPEQPRCGFSRTLVQLLAEQKVEYSSFDILSDEDVRQGIKEYSNWPTYPQIYINGDLVGGLDIVKELVASGEFQTMLPASKGSQSPASLEDRLKAIINRQPVMLFMKGSPDSPKCGFSRTIVGLLNGKRVKYGHFDILEDEEVRQGLKTYSNWPTYPQLYVRGEFVGGLDIVKEMNDSGDLDTTLADFIN